MGLRECTGSKGHRLPPRWQQAANNMHLPMLLTHILCTCYIKTSLLTGATCHSTWCCPWQTLHIAGRDIEIELGWNYSKLGNILKSCQIVCLLLILLSQL